MTTTIDPFIGRRIREIRVWRGMTQRAVAELAGVSEGYLSRIEGGKRPVDRRSLLEAIAAALRVAPSELAEQAFPPAAADSVTGEAQATVAALDAALTTSSSASQPGTHGHGRLSQPT